MSQKLKFTDINIADIVEGLGRKPTIFIVDDEKDIREVLEAAFSYVGYEVTTASCTAQAARSIIEGNKYDVVLSDYNNNDGESRDVNGGRTLYDTLQKGNALPQVYMLMSGQEREKIAIPDGVSFKSKPFLLYDIVFAVTEELRQKIREKNKGEGYSYSHTTEAYASVLAAK